MKKIDYYESLNNKPKMKISEDAQTPAKVQKLNKTNMSPLKSPKTPPDSTLSSLEEQLAVMQMKLSHTTAMVTHFQNKKEHIEQVLEEELDNLKHEYEVDKKLVKQLEVRLATERRCSQQSYDSQESVDLLNFQLRTRMRGKISNLLSQNLKKLQSISQDTSPSPGTQESDERLEAVRVRMEIELERMLEDSIFLPFDEEGSKGVEIKIERMGSVEACFEDSSITSSSVHEDESVDQIILQNEESRKRKLSSAALDTISGIKKTGALLSEKRERLRIRLDDMRKKHERVLQTCEELKRMGEDMMKKNVGEGESVVIEDENPSQEVVEGLGEVNGPPDEDQILSAPSYLETKADDGDPAGAEQLPENLEITVSDYWVLASDQRWFEIDWLEHYTQDVSHVFVCNKCSLTLDTKIKIQDHIWVAHFGGAFKCPHCPGSSRSLKRRYSIGQHVRSIHPDTYRTRK